MDAPLYDFCERLGASNFENRKKKKKKNCWHANKLIGQGARSLKKERRKKKKNFQTDGWRGIEGKMKNELRDNFWVVVAARTGKKKYL